MHGGEPWSQSALEPVGHPKPRNHSRRAPYSTGFYLASVRPGGRFTAVEAALSAREARHPHAPEAVKASNFGFAELVLAAESWSPAVSQAWLIVVHGVCAQQALEGRVPRISQD